MRKLTGRLFYTPEMTVDISSVWKAAADAQWGGGGKCVSGGQLGQKRNLDETTTKLGPRRVHVPHATALKRAQAFERSFTLKTECELTGDGFVQP